MTDVAVPNRTVTMYAPDTGAPVDVATADVPAKFLSGELALAPGTKLAVRTARGKVGEIDAEQAEAAFRSRMSVATPEDIRDDRLTREANTFRGGVETGLHAFGEEGSLGFAEPLLVDAMAATRGETPAEARERILVNKRENPFINAGGAIAGFGATMLATEGIGSALKGAGVAARGLRGAEGAAELAGAARAGRAATGLADVADAGRAAVRGAEVVAPRAPLAAELAGVAERGVGAGVTDAARPAATGLADLGASAAGARGATAAADAAVAVGEAGEAAGTPSFFRRAVVGDAAAAEATPAARALAGEAAAPAAGAAVPAVADIELAEAAAAPARRAIFDASLARTVAREAGFGAAYGMGHEVSEATLGDRPIVASNLFAAGLGGAVIGGTFAGALSVTGRLAGAALSSAMGRVGTEAGEGGLRRAVGEWARRLESEMTFKAAGGIKSERTMAGSNVKGGVDAVVDELVSGGHVTYAKSSLHDIAASVEKALAEQNAKRAAIVAEANKTGASVAKSDLMKMIDKKAEDARVFEWQTVVSPEGIRERVKIPVPARTAEYNAYVAYKRDLQVLLADESRVSLERLQQLRSDIKRQAWKGVHPFNNESLSVEMKRDFERGLEEMWTARADQVMAASGSPGMRAEYEEAKKRVHRLIFANEMVERGLDRKMGNRWHSLSDHLVGLSGFHALGPTGLAMGVANKAIRERGPAIIATTLRKLRTLDVAAETVALTESRIAQGARAVASATGRAVTRAPVALMAASHSETPKETYDRVGAQLQRFEKNPDALFQQQAEQMGHLAADMPDTVGEVARMQAKMLAYFLETMPKPPPTMAMTPGDWRPSDSALFTFQQRVRAGEDPVSLLDDLRQGVMHPAAVQTVQTTAAPLFDEMRQVVLAEMQRAAAAGQLPAPAVQLAVTRAFGVPVSPAMTRESASATVAAYASMAQEGGPQGGAGPSGAARGGSKRERVVDLGATYKTENQQAMAEEQ